MGPDDHWRRFRASGDAAALGAVFDAVSPELFRVALSLADDAASAEDALQETWLVALRSAERHDPARPVVPWLVGILRRKIHEERRTARSPDSRRLRPVPDAPDPSLAAESAEDTARLRAAIDALPKAYREIAVLRWRYGLAPGEIADVRCMPPGTVRSLLHRALARLRRDMKGAPALLFGTRWPRGLDDVRRNVLRAAATKSSVGTAAVIAGGLIVAKTTKTVVLVALACLLLGAGAVVQMTGDQATPTRLSHEDPIAFVGNGTSRPEPRTHRDEPTHPPATDAGAEKPFARGIVVDEAGAPIAGCRVIVRGHEQSGDDVQDAPVRLDASSAAVTGADGTFVVPKKPGDLASLTFVADGFEAVEERSFEADLRVVLSPSGSFEARVVDTAGDPIVGADVRVIGAWAKSQPRWTNVWLRAATDESGRFAFRSLPKEARLGTVSAWGYRLPGPQMNFLAEQDVYVLERSCLIVDATDSISHAPLADARGLLVGADGSLVGVLEPQPAIASTPARAGRIFWSRSRRTGEFAAELRVFAPGHRTRSMPLAMAADAEPPLLEVALDPGEETPMLAGRVIDGSGAVVAARFAPRHDGRPVVYGSDLLLPVAAESIVEADGSFAITSIPAGAYRLTVTRAGAPPLALDVIAPATSLELRLPPRAELEVRWSDTAGRPVAGAWMHVQSGDERFGWDVMTDTAGIARFDALPAGEVIVIPLLRGVVRLAQFGGLPALGPMPAARRTLAAGSSSRVDLVRPDRCRVSVVVKDDSGHPVRGVEIHVATSGGLARFDRDERARVEALAPETDAEGRVAFEVLPCRGEVKALRQGRVNSAKLNAEIGSSPTVEIVLPSVTGTIRGRVLERGSNAPVSARPVKLWWDGKVIAESATGDDGRFVASGVPAGRVRVSVQGMTDANDFQGRRVDPNSPYGSAQIEFDMTAGEEHVVALTLPRINGPSADPVATTMDVTVVDGAGSAPKGAWVLVRGLIDGAWCTLGDAQTLDGGRVRLAVVAAERYRIAATLGARRVEVEREAAAAIGERLTLPNE